MEFRQLGHEVQGIAHGRMGLVAFVVAGVALGLFLRARDKATAPATSTGAAAAPEAFTPAQQLEWARINQEAAREKAQLTASTQLEQQKLAFQAGGMASYGTRCIPLKEWYRLTPKLREEIRSQQKNGKVLILPSAAGMCLVPTGIGYQGHQPIIEYDASNGLFSSGVSVSGPAGSFNPNTTPGQPAIGGIINSLAQFAPFIFGTPGGVPGGYY